MLRSTEDISVVAVVAESNWTINFIERDKTPWSDLYMALIP
jgi:hypothetical protein